MNVLARRLPRFRFRLATLLILVAIGSVALAVLYRHKTPMTHGAMYQATCRESDWNSLAKPPPKSKTDGFSAFVFEVEKPEDLFDGFSEHPQLWGKTDIADIPRRPRYWQGFQIAGSGGYMNVRRYRDPESPVQGTNTVNLDKSIRDECMFAGEFTESTIPPRRYEIGFDVEIATRQVGLPRSVPGALTKTSSRLKFHGTASGNLIVFSKPMEDGLVRLILIDLR